MERITNILTKHGWPPATLTVVLLLTSALYVLYHDHRELQHRWEGLARGNLEANFLAVSQREKLQDMLQQNMIAQEKHLSMISDMEKARLHQQALDQQLTAAAIQALRQIAEKKDVQMQLVKPDDIVNPP